MKGATGAFLLSLILSGVVAHADGRVAEAVKAGDLQALRALLQQGVDVNAPEPDGSTALHWAAHRGDLAAVDLLLRAGARATVANRYRVTPLALAAESGGPAVVARLIQSGADPNTAVVGGETVLMTAARAGKIEVVRTLIASGADVNTREATRGQTALMWAAAEGHVDVIRVLLEHSAELKATSHRPSAPKEVTDGAEGYTRMGRVAPRVDVFTPLQFAVHAGQLDATRALLDAGADIKDETPQGMGLLTMAVANAHFDVAALLIERGVDVNHAKIGWTPLHQIARVRTLSIGWGPPHPQPSGGLTSLDIARLLLERGATVDARNTKPWHDGYRGIFVLNATPLMIAAKGGDAEMMRLLAANGADVMATNANGTTVMMLAAGVEMMNPNEDSGRDADGLAALKVAMELHAGDINAVNKSGDTALHGTIARVSPEAAKFLVENGAKLDAKNKRGLRPIDLALGVSLIGGIRFDTARMLSEAMLAQGLTPPAIEVNKERYRFGVKEAK